MNKILLTGILVVLGLVITFFNPLLILILAVGVWIYLVRMVWKHKKGVLSDKMGPKINEVQLKRLKSFLMAAGISLLVFIAGAIVHNASYDLSEMETTVPFLIALAALLVFVTTTAAGMIIFIKERSKTT